MDEIKTSIAQEGQRYLDEPVMAEIAKRFTSPLADALAQALGNVRYYRDSNGMPRSERMDLPKPILLRYERINLRWMKPDGHGGLIPKGDSRCG